jgi:hypothetical protein
MYSENLKKTLSGSSSLRSRQFTEGEKSKLPLEAYEGPLVSVTERTTKLLEEDDVVETGNGRRKKP